MSAPGGQQAQLHFREAYWPAFREIDFLRAPRNFARREA
jgi:short-chain Z-isoprenyl diphosphate synthase